MNDAAPAPPVLEAPEIFGAPERELKLDLDPASVERLLGSDALTGEPRERMQRSIYFDTPGRALLLAGLTLRIRHEDGRRVQTVKLAGAAAAGLFVRDEFEREVDGDDPVVNETAGPVVALVPPDELAALAPAFEVLNRRRLWNIEREGALIEVALDCGEAVAGGRRDPFCEVELELKRGDPAALFALARTLGEAAPLRLGVLTKSERGFRLLATKRAKPVKAAPVALSPGASAADAFRAVAHACLRQFRLNEPLIVAKADAGALHQARVGLRRLRSALSVMKPMLEDATYPALRDGLRGLAATLGEGRDLDVLIGRVQEPAALRRLKRARKAVYVDIVEALGSDRVRGLMLDLAEWIAIGPWTEQEGTREQRDRAAPQFAADLLDRLRGRVKRRGRRLASVDDDARHALRIEAKKLRYTSEFFGGLYTGRKPERRRAAFQEALENLQTALGDLNDIVHGPSVLARHGLSEAIVAPGTQESKEQLIADAAEAHAALIDVKRFWR